MPGVQADAVTVLIEAKTAKYLADMEAAAKKTEAVFARIRNANKPISLNSTSKSTNSTAEREALKTEGVIRREAEKTAAAKQRLADKTAANASVQASKTASAEEKAAAKAALAAEKAAQRKAAADEKAAQRSIDAANKAAAREIAAQERIAAAVERGLTRRANAAAGGTGLGGTAGSKALAARQTAAMRGGTALGGGGTMPAPTPAGDKVNYFLRDQIDTQSRFNAAQAAGNREEANALRDQLTQFRLINQYKRAGLDETEATARAEDRVAEIARRRANRAQAAPTDAAPTRSGGGLAGAARTVRNVAAIGFAGYGLAQGAREYLELTDAYKQYNAQLKLATAENGNLAQAQLDTQRIATTTRSGLAETAQLYATFQRNAGQLGLSQEQSARATETVTKAFQISGATAAEASGGLRQFLQGLQSGTLRGEEFNSVVENAPRLAKLLADQLTGGNIGALRALSAAGKITGKDLKEALTNQKFTAQIDAEFKQLPVTFDQAMTVVKNAATVTFGEFDQGGQFSTALANFITGGSAGFADLAKSASDTGIDIRAMFAGLSDAFAPLLSGAQSAFAGIRGEANYTRESIANILGAIDRIRNAPKELQDFVEGGNADFRKATGFKSASPDRSNLAGNFLAGARTSEAAARRDRSARRLEALGFIVPRNKDGSINEAGIQRPSANRSSSFTPRGATAVNQDLKKYTDLNADLEKLKATASGKELATINKKIAKNNQIIGNLNQGVSLAAATAAASGGGGRAGPSAATLAKRAEAARMKAVRNDDAYNAEAERLNSDILSAKGKQAQTIEQTAQAAIDNANAELKERELKYQNQENEGKITDQQRLVLVGLAGQVRAQQILTANTEKAAALADQSLQILSNQQSNEADALRSQLDMTKSRAQRERLTQQLIEKEYEARRTSLAAQLQAATERGDVAGQLDAEGKLRNLPGQQAADEFRNREDNKSPYQKYRENLTNADSLSDEIDNIKIEVLDQVADSLANATTKALGLTGALGDIVGQIIKIGIQRRLIGPIADTLFGSATGGGSGALGGLFSSLFGGARASGGDVSAGKIYRINENGGEYFQPAMSGKIIPTGRAASASGGSTIIQPQINVDARGSVMADTFAKQILARADNTAKAYAAQSGKAAYKNAPQSSRDYQQQRG